MSESLETTYVRVFKPVMDRSVAFAGLLSLWPLWLFMVVVNKLIGLPAHFKHTRPGQNEKVFELWKICTIDPRSGKISKYAQALRSTSLDEIPQLWNILKGEMSFVGPRPLLIEYMEGYTPEQRKRHLLRPGITGWAQVHGRNDLDLSEKVEYDLEYLSRVSFAMDLKILLMTFRQVLRFRQADGHSGNKKSMA